MARTRVELKSGWVKDSRHGSNLFDPEDELELLNQDFPFVNDLESINLSAVQPPKKEVNRVRQFWEFKIVELKIEVKEKKESVYRLAAARNNLNSKVKEMRDELEELKSLCCYVAEVIKVVREGKKVWCLIKISVERFFVEIGPDVPVEGLVPGARVACRVANLELIKILPPEIDPLVSMMLVETCPDVTYDQLGGLDKQIKEVKEVVELPIKHPELFESLGIAQPKGVILYGPPGTGKTLLARAVAHHTSCHFIRVAGTELIQKYIGEGARMVREIFVLARKHAPSIIFMDEVDAVGATRKEGGSGGNSEVQRTMLELLNQLDGFEATSNIKIIMATNRIDILDEALLRPGRIDRKIELLPPNEDGRLDILRIHSSKMNLVRGINLRAIVEELKGASGAEIKSVCTEAGMFAMRERRSHVNQEDFQMAATKVMKMDAIKDVSLAKLWK